MGLPAIYDVLGMYGRDDVTRTRDPYVPNVVRYQLRYISISWFFPVKTASAITFRRSLPWGNSLLNSRLPCLPSQIICEMSEDSFRWKLRQPSPFVGHYHEVTSLWRFLGKEKEAVIVGLLPSSYKKTSKGQLSLWKFIDVNCNTALKVSSFVLVDDTDLGELVDHCVNLRGVCLCRCLVGCVSQRTDCVPCRLCIILIMQSAPLALAIALVCWSVVCHCSYFYIFS